MQLVPHQWQVFGCLCIHPLLASVTASAVPDELLLDAGLARNTVLMPVLPKCFWGWRGKSSVKVLVLPKESREKPSCVALPLPSQSSWVFAPLPPIREPRSSKAALAKPDALAAAASLLAERIRLLTLSKPPRCSAAAPSHPVFRCHYLNTLLIRPWSTEVCSHWSSAHST